MTLTDDEHRAHVNENYAGLRDDPVAALEQIRGELFTALELGIASGSTETLCRGLMLKAELGLGW